MLPSMGECQGIPKNISKMAMLLNCWVWFWREIISAPIDYISSLFVRKSIKIVKSRKRFGVLHKFRGSPKSSKIQEGIPAENPPDTPTTGDIASGSATTPTILPPEVELKLSTASSNKLGAGSKKRGTTSKTMKSLKSIGSSRRLSIHGYAPTVWGLTDGAPLPWRWDYNWFQIRDIFVWPNHTLFPYSWWINHKSHVYAGIIQK